ncbi:MAG: hypothetical protein BGO78_01400 [Chloroflexi bacterium 44-23]|nr:MAG: hypothetical protein BGO78_01400 [Chloroflexi bacterium 44-23]
MEKIKSFIQDNDIFRNFFLAALFITVAIIFHPIISRYQLSYLILLVFGLFFGISAWIKKDFSQFVLAIFITSVLSPIVYYFIILDTNFSFEKVGYILVFASVGIIILNVYWYIHRGGFLFWNFPIIVVFSGASIALLFTSHRPLDFIFYVGVATGIVLLGSGLYWKLFGLVIPGTLLVGSVAGIFFAWGNPSPKNALVRTGIMLVWMALGWGLVTVFSRFRTLKFLWWPLIPGGVFAMVGWGLYIGGNPESAIGFIGNTGSIGLLIFGIYILLLRRGIHR